LTIESNDNKNDIINHDNTKNKIINNENLNHSLQSDISKSTDYYTGDELVQHSLIADYITLIQSDNMSTEQLKIDQPSSDYYSDSVEDYEN
jgi:hypothetical protein